MGESRIDNRVLAFHATVAQLVEQRIRNARVSGSSPLSGSLENQNQNDNQNCNEYANAAFIAIFIFDCNFDLIEAWLPGESKSK